MLNSAILDEARFLVGDSKKTKYSDNRLVMAYNSALRKLCTKVTFNQGNALVLLLPEENVYALPSDVLYIQRITYNSKPIPLLSHSDLDNKYPDGWEQITSDNTLKGIVFDLMSPNKIKVFPRLISPEALTMEGLGLWETDGSLMGGIVSVTEYSNGSTTIYESDDGTGVLVNITSETGGLLLSYVKRPNWLTLATMSNEFEYDIIYTDFMTFYIAGHLLDDNDKLENLQKADSFYKKAYASIDEMLGLVSRGYHLGSLEVPYRRPF